jgi:hypothetical protein
MENARPSRFRLRLGTLLVVVVILALLIVVVIQQMQIGQMRQRIDASMKEKDQLTTIVRELRDHLNRAASSSDARNQHK